MNIKISVTPTPESLGLAAANQIAALINQAIIEKGSARIALSTGSSQFETLSALIGMEIPWEKVEMFHLDEYVALPESHPASFRKYLKERFTSKVNLKSAHFVNGEGDVQACIRELTQQIRLEPLDVGVIGIGENAHIAFNDPPADFNTDEAYKLVVLDDKCKQQQVGEGWFTSVSEVPIQAITMTVRQIMSCAHIVTCVPHAVKAQAILDTLTKPVSPEIPATMLKTHPDWRLYLDAASASSVFRI